MKQSRLNLAVLRARLRASSPGSASGEAASTSGLPRYSRRQWLGMAGTAALISTPGLKSIGSMLLGSVTFQYTKTTASFSIRGQEQWVIDTRRFSGAPILFIDRTDARILIELRNARYPGTELPADFTCELTPASSGWEMRLRFPGGFDVQSAFEPWLLRVKKVVSAWSPGSILLRVPGGKQEVRITRDVQTSFSPDWMLEMSAPDAFVVAGLGEPLPSSHATVSLCTRDQQSFLKQSPTRRTMLVFRRSDHVWPLVPSVGDGKQWTFVSTGSAFSLIRVEAAEDRAGRRTCALIAEPGEEENLLWLCPSRALRGTDGSVFALPLRAPQYALAFGRSQNESAVLARFGGGAWLAAGHASIELGDSPAAKPFELVGREGRIQHVQCVPAALRTLTPLPGAIVEPVSLGGEKSFALASAQVGQQKKGAQKAPQPNVSQGNVSQAVNALWASQRISAVRSADLLKLEFEFKNFELKKGGTGTTIVPSKPGDPSYIIVHFPPQNIAEQAFLETEPPKNILLKFGSSGDSLPNLPVERRLSGPSRLVFRIRSGAAPIPYTLEGLLSACLSSDLNVSLAASKLTKQQHALLTTIANNSSSIKAAVQSSEAVVSRLKGEKAGAKVAAKQADLATLRKNNDAIASLPQGFEIPRSVQKRLAALQKAAAQDAQGPVAAARAEALSNLMSCFALSRVSAQLSPGLMGTIDAIVNPTPANPGPEETAIEAPYRLTISPHGFAAWIHAIDAVTHNNWTELWQTRLGVRANGMVSEEGGPLRTVRAVWSPDYREKSQTQPKHGEGNDKTPEDPFRMSLDRFDRNEIVHLTSNFKLNPPNFEPAPANVEQLMLTSLGAWMHVYGSWDPTKSGLALEFWRHRGTMGRDHYVRVVYAGYLFPFGHKASLIKITERKIQNNPKGDPTAYLRQRLYIVVREQEKVFPAAGQNNVTSGTKDARSNPFRRIRVTTLITPNLDSPSDTDVDSRSLSAFWPFVAKKPFLFHFVGEDWDGRLAEFTAPIIFTDFEVAFNPAVLVTANSKEHAVAANYMSYGDRRKREMNGQKIAYAESSAPGDTTFETDSITFAADWNLADMAAMKSQGTPPFYPTIEQAEAHVKAVEQLVGTPSASAIAFDKVYLTDGLDSSSNKGQVFLSLLDPVKVDFSSDSTRSGGLVTPNVNIGGLSRSLGAVGGSLDETQSGKFDPVSFFKGVMGDAKLFGALPLSILIEKVADFTGMLDKVPKFQNEETPEYVNTRYVWKPNLQISNDPTQGSFLSNMFQPHDPQNGMSVTVTLHRPTNGDEPTFDVLTQISDFEIHLLPQPLFMIIRIKKILFSMGSGRKLDVSVEMGETEFAGSLSFVNTLQKFLPPSGFSDPPGLKVTAKGVTASFSLGLPTIAVGMFSLQNVSLGAAMELPFDGRVLNIKFLFCERENPFLLTVSIYGGGGFFGVTVTPAGLAMLEASLEFGGAVALSLGVATGSVYVMAGIYYKKAGDVNGFDGYLRAGGCLEVLGLISISTEFYMVLGYQTNGKVHGMASLTVKVEVLFFSKSVALSVERQFKGSSGDPLFKDTMELQDWNQYLGAFA